MILKENLTRYSGIECHSFKSENGTMRVLKGSLVIMKAVIKNSLYILQGNTVLRGSATAEKKTNKA